MKSPGMRTPVKVISINEMADRIKKLEFRLKKVIEIADDYAYAAGKWIDSDIDCEEFYSWKEELENEL